MQTHILIHIFSLIAFSIHAVLLQLYIQHMLSQNLLSWNPINWAHFSYYKPRLIHVKCWVCEETDADAKLEKAKGQRSLWWTHLTFTVLFTMFFNLDKTENFSFYTQIFAQLMIA